jgi:hypothetical protein
MRIPGVLLALLVLALSTALAQPASQTDLYSGVRIDGYVGETYTKRSRADYNALFTGGPVRLAVVVGNRSENGRHLSLPAEGEVIGLAVMRDDSPIDPPVSVEKGFVRRRVGGVEFVESAPTFRLAGKEELVWPVSVDEPLPPGLYEVEVTVNATPRDGGSIFAVQPTVSFEVRPADAEPVEVARRQALRALASLDLREAENAGLALLKLHPASYEAVVVLGRIALARGATDDAKTHLARALSILDNGEDTYLRQHNSPQQIESIRQAVEELSRRMP